MDKFYPVVRRLRGIGPSGNTKKRHVFGNNDIVGTKLFKSLKVDFSDLRLHEFDHRFNCDSCIYPHGRGSKSA